MWFKKVKWQQGKTLLVRAKPRAAGGRCDVSESCGSCSWELRWRGGQFARYRWMRHILCQRQGPSARTLRNHSAAMVMFFSQPWPCRYILDSRNIAFGSPCLEFCMQEAGSRRGG